VPSGYVVQGSAPGVLAIAEPDDHSSIYTFVGKLVVTVEEKSDLGTLHGRPVQVGSNAGTIRTGTDGVKTLEYALGDRVVVVQSWKNIALDDQQIIAFAQGITVTSDAQLSSG
jgi:hypothetical protein